MGPHVPAGESHASHWPVHALSQHTPSAQNPLVQASAERHALPFEPFGVHVPALHHAEEAHWELVTHDVVHPPFEQRNGAHSTLAPFEAHVPAPSHSWPRATVPWQTPTPQETPAGVAARHAPAPLHCPSAPQSTPEGAQSLRGSVPSREGPQVPSATPLCLSDAAHA
jgi:hypothetical protein